MDGRSGADAAARTMRAGILIALCCLAARCASAVPCDRVHHAPPIDADKAFLAADYPKAESLYRAALAAAPGNTGLTAGLVHGLLRDQKLQEAADAVKAALAASPKSAELITLRGEVEFRQGEPWTAAQTANESVKLDPCNARTHLLLADYAEAASLHATAKNQIGIAHQIDPDDPEIREKWISFLPSKEQIPALEELLQSPSGLDGDERHDLQLDLDHLKKLATGSQKSCRLVTPVTEIEVPFERVMYDVYTVEAFALNVQLNGSPSRLEVDTGASGLLVSRSVAERAGLKPLAKTEIAGVGDQGPKAGYTAFADSIRIGGLEFRDCMVDVLDSRRVIDVDGLIGMDVFSRFLVTLDYPLHKMVLSPLPARPGEEQAVQVLNTAGASTDDSNSGGELEPQDRYIAPEMKGYTPVYRSGHDLILPATINKSKFKLFILDTGAWSTTVSPDAAREVTKMYQDRQAAVKGLSGKVSKVYVTRNIKFRFANVEQDTFGINAFGTSAESKGAGMEISGFIGATTLDQMTVRIDYRDGLVKFDYDPNRRAF